MAGEHDGTPEGAEGRRPAGAATAATVGAPARGRESDLVGRMFDDKFLILRLIGIGGFGAVYAARDVALECDVAIKILHGDVAGDEQSRRGFLEEVRRLTRLKHPNVVGWKALAQTADGTAYFVMELLEGRDLLELLDEAKTLPPQRAAGILLQILDALRAAHHLPDGECLLHLDLKPSNVFLEAHPSGRRDLDWVKVIDFGISQFLGADAVRAAAPESSAPDAGRPERTIHRATDDADGATRMGGRGGVRVNACTPEYAAPEQGAHLLDGEECTPLDERADLYSVGVIGFRMVTGRLPFDDCGSDDELLRTKLRRDAPPVESLAPRVPRRLARFIDRCLQRDRALRHASAAAAHAELDLLVHPRIGRRAVALGATVAVLLTLSGWVLRPKSGALPIDLYETGPDQERLLQTGEVLCLGPGHAEMELRVKGMELAAKDRLRLTADPSADAETLGRWSATVRDRSQILVRAETPQGRTLEPAYLEVTRDGAPPRYSAPFQLEWLADDAVRLTAGDVAGRKERGVDPLEQRFEIEVDGLRDDVARIEVACGRKRCEAEYDPAASAPRRGIYRVPLRALEPADGPVDLEVRLVDRAGNVKNASTRFDVVSAPLAFARSPALSAAQRVGPRWFVRDPALARLAYALSNVADLEAVVYDESRTPIGTRSIAATTAGELALADFDLGHGDRDFSGTIELRAADGAHVLRSDAGGRGTATARVEFFSAARPRIAVDLSGTGRARPRPLVAGEPYFTSSRRLEVHVTRQSDVPVRVALVDRKSGADAAANDREAQLVGPSDQHFAFDVDLGGAGVHDLVVRCWRCVDADDRKRAPDLDVEFVCIVDDSPPLLAVTPVEAEERSRKSSIWPASAELRVTDRSNGDGAPPTKTELRYEVVRADRPTQPLFEAAFATPVAPGATLPLRLPFPSDAAKTPVLADGRYLLRLLAADEAGNAALPVELPFEVAQSGPTVELKRPVAAAVWKPEADGSYALRAITEDANGVAAATAKLSIPDVAPIEVALAAETLSNHGAYVEWSGSARVPRSWTRREIQLECTARDRRGRATSVVLRLEAGSIERASPNCVRVQRGGFELGAMRLVRGNHDAPYVFGGRSDDTEEKLFGAVGLGTYNHLRRQKSWESRFEPDAIADYYLDEREVTVAEFRRFLADESGYAAKALWPAGAHPDADRLRELQAALREADGDRPVVGVTWDEAAAFARWAGKRLPAFVEWEYALRGGPLYRACAAGEAKAAARAAAPADAPRPARQGGDVTPDTRIWNLTGNVAEWSATPAATPAEREEESPARFAALHPLWFLRARGGDELAHANEFWVVGASFRQEHADFSAANARSRRWSGMDVGFRCAASLDDVVRVLEVADPALPVFTEGASE